MIDPFQQKHTFFLWGGHSVACHITRIETHQRFFRWKLSPRHGSCGNKWSDPYHAGQGEIHSNLSLPKRFGVFYFFLGPCFELVTVCFVVSFLGGNDEGNMSFVELNCVHTSPFNEPRDLNRRIGVLTLTFAVKTISTVSGSSFSQGLETQAVHQSRFIAHRAMSFSVA